MTSETVQLQQQGALWAWRIAATGASGVADTKEAAKEAAIKYLAGLTGRPITDSGIEHPHSEISAKLLKPIGNVRLKTF